MSKVTPPEFEIAHFQWGPGDLPAPTDTTTISASFKADGGLRLLGYDMGLETKKLSGEFDWGYWVDIPFDELQSTIALLFALLFEGRDTDLTFDELKSALEDQGIEYTEGEGPYDAALKRNTPS